MPSVSPKTIANIITVYLKPLSEKYEKPIDGIIQPLELIELAGYFDQKKINNQGLQKALDFLAEKTQIGDGEEDKAQTLEELLQANNLLQISDDSVLTAIVEQVIVDNPGPVADYKGGKEQSVGFLIGQCMKASKGSGNPQMFKDLLIQKLT